MQQIFDTYISEISKKYSREETSEYGYRTPFENLLKEIFANIGVKEIDHDPKTDNGNKPDFIIHKDTVPLLYIETKDIGVSLDKVEKSAQMGRYFGYANLVLTDYLEFRFYRNGLPYEEPIKIGEYNKKERSITPFPNQYEHLARTLTDFTKSHKEPITSGEHLAKIMGGKAQRIRDNVKDILKGDSEKKEELMKVYEMMKKLLVHDLNSSTFADMYAQTLVYGLFVARYHDETPDDFTRQEARDLIPPSNPLLREFFDHITGTHFDKRLEPIVNELCRVFSHADIEKLMKDYYQREDGKDPVIHFYEDFLQEYDAKLRKKMGAYYTPLPVVNFIIRSVDEILKKDFKLRDGLADSSKYDNGEHVVQVLDPATGTGTFISSIITKIHQSILDSGLPGRWNKYIYNDLLPRIHAFELMMAPYTIAHLKISMTLKEETGFKHFNNARLGIYLTNSLEGGIQHEIPFGFGLAESIAEESKEALKIKKEKPIMIVIGNPPYSAASSNRTPFANGLVKKYKVEPGGKQKLNEKKNWLNDDYVKFIALAEDMIEKNEQGILGFITNHGYIDNPTFRGMRWHLMKTFSSLYILNLHGNTNRKEQAPTGDKDENVFNIQQGVSILLAVKEKNSTNKECKVKIFDLWGSRKNKFKQLNTLSLKNIPWEDITPELPYLSFTPAKSSKLKNTYIHFFSLNDIFTQKVTGILTRGDNFITAYKEDDLSDRVYAFLSGNIPEAKLRSEYTLSDSYISWIISNRDLITDPSLVPIAYRPFDKRYSSFNNKLVWRTRTKVMRHFINKDNIGMIFARQSIGGKEYNHIFATKNISDNRIFYSNKGIPLTAPLYIYSDDGTKTPNLNQEIVDKIEKTVGKTTPEKIFDYIYAVLHSPKYREKYKEFLKIDFPRVPYPKDKESFKKLVKIGKELRELHLMESTKANQPTATYPITGTDTVEKVIYKDNKVYINNEQYFGNVPEIAWNFYIGGYQPAQKWLKDRKGRILDSDDIDHYAKIITVLVETERIIKEIDKLK